VSAWFAALCILAVTEALALFWLWQWSQKKVRYCRRIESDLKQSLSANESKSLFLANTSHEIRTPLGAILGFAKLMEDPSLDCCERTKYGAMVKRTGEALLAIVNDILDLSKVEAGHIEVKKSHFLLRPLLEEVCFICEGKHGHKQSQITVKLDLADSVDDAVYSDPRRLQQILINVLGNAFKFTEQGTIILRVEQTPKELLFKIRDTGRGIRREDQHLLFCSFRQIESSPLPSAEGTGIGLVLSRNLARLLGGELSLEYSEHGKGSGFLLTVPREVQEAALTAKVDQARKPSASQVNGKRILLVEDSEINRIMMEHILHQGGMQVETAKNGEEAVCRALDNDYDALLMDVQMPIMDGREATRQLRRMGYSRPIIALTAHAMKEDRDRCLEAGYDDYLSKPVQFEDLFSTIAKVLDEDPPPWQASP
jgi:hypothetical protein